jgi:hypothetical protein
VLNNSQKVLVWKKKNSKNVRTPMVWYRLLVSNLTTSSSSSSSSSAKANQHPPVQHEGWMVSDQQTLFLLGFSSLANHGG